GRGKAFARGVQRLEEEDRLYGVWWRAAFGCARRLRDWPWTFQCQCGEKRHPCGRGARPRAPQRKNRTRALRHCGSRVTAAERKSAMGKVAFRSEEHTSELQSREN